MNLLVENIKFLIYSIMIVLIAKYILVKILRKIGELLELKPKVIGNIAGIATSIPELLTVSFSAFAGLITTSTYNIISSNIINLLQYSIAIILNKNQKAVRNQAIKVDLSLVIITILIPIMMIIFQIEHNMILIPIFLVLLFLFYRISNNAHKLYMKKEKGTEDKNEEGERINKNVESSIAKRYFYVFIYGILLFLVGVALYIIGNLLSDVLENLCIRFQIPEIIIGMLLGFITSLPELITFFESQKHHENEKEGVVEATSNLLTSNIMNLFVIQSIGILIYAIIS